MIYTSAIDQITWDAIVEFCQQGRTEDAYLDYKRDFPSDLANTISAMANTMGGIIIISVQEDTESKPALPVPGIDFTRGLEERVTNIILGNIVPPVFPEVRVCRNSENRALVLIRIQQSENAPHAVSRNTKIYLRTGNVNKPEDLAQIDQIEWLKNRRQKSENLRDSLFSRARQRASNQGNTLHLPLLTLAISPVYPNIPLTNPSELSAIRWDIEHKHGIHSMPDPDNKCATFAHESIVIEDRDAHGSSYTELSIFGMYFSQACLLDITDSKKVMYLDHIFIKLFLLLTSGEKLYSHLGYRGPVWFCCHLTSLQNRAMRGSYTLKMHSEKMCRDSEVRLIDSLPMLPKDEDKIGFLSRVGRTIAWAFGWDLSEEDLTKHFNIMEKAVHVT